MRIKKGISLAGLVILLSILVWAVALDQMNGWFSFRWFEFRVKRSVDPIELQQWATNLLAQHGSDFGGYEDFDGTNVPSRIREFKGRYPGVRIFAPGEVCVFCDSKGVSFLVVGPPSLSTPTNQNFSPWKPGIYFVRPSL